MSEVEDTVVGVDDVMCEEVCTYVLLSSLADAILPAYGQDTLTPHEMRHSLFTLERWEVENLRDKTVQC